MNLTQNLIFLSSKILRVLKIAPWATSFLTLLAFSGVYYVNFQSYLFFSYPIFLWGAASSLGFFFLMHVFYSCLAKPLQWVFAVIFGLFLFWLVIVNFFIFHEFGQFLNASMIHFILNDTQYILDYFMTFFSYKLFLPFSVLLTYFIWLWFPKSNQHKQTWKTYVGLFFLILALVGNADFLRKKTKVFHLPITSTAVTGIIELWFNDLNHRTLVYPLHKAKRIALRSAETEYTPNILLILNESFSKMEGIPFYGNTDNAMPYLTSLIENNTDQWLIFERAFTNSTATDVSVPSVLTGVGPFESGSKLHKMPLIWDWAKAANKNTFLLSAQRFDWGGFDDFFFSHSLDTYVTSEEINAPVVNDLGVDDLIMIKELPKILAEIPKEKGFVGVINSNALHGPFLQTSTQLSDQPHYDNRYKNALYILDQMMKRVIESLGDTLEDTIIIVTSDHGERSPFTDHKTHRLYGFYEEYFGIPFLIYVPKKWERRNQYLVKYFKENRQKNVQNLDIIPTIADILKLSEKNNDIIRQYKGSSLGKYLSKERYIVGLNTNDTRWWDQEGFGISHGSNRLIVSNVSGIFYGNIMNDPLQKENLWDTVAFKKKKSLESYILQNQYLARVWKLSLDLE